MPHPPSRVKLPAPPFGFSFFWALNDQCDRSTLLSDLHRFQEAGVTALVLHPRGGLLLPYGSDSWFSLIRWLCEECRKRGIEPVLYDEDPYPSGNAGGRIVAEHPEFAGCEIKKVSAEGIKEGELFLFPAGRLCWAGIIFPGQPKKLPIDLTSEVGMIRRHWEKAEWDSRWYYPTTPVYPAPRAFALQAEYGLRSPRIPVGGQMVAFVASPITTDTEWGYIVDALNPRATECFLAYTHERYARVLGSKLGSTVRAIFTDEPKPHCSRPWTPGLFEAFEEKYGYDLRPRLNHLFSSGDDRPGMRVRADYREWVAQRFDSAWMRPVSEWCTRHQLALIGHLSPEEDPINQANCLGSYFSRQKHLSLSGFDVIIPAVGDRRHSILNIAAISAVSASQQHGQPGVCCESLGANGKIAPRQIARILGWQTLHGVNFPVMHAAFASQTGLRRFEAPPDLGPHSPYWSTLIPMLRQLEPFAASTRNAIQEASVAVLWPLLSFEALGLPWQPNNTDGLRRDLMDILSECLDNQIGVHFIDEETIAKAKTKNGRAYIGNAAYRTIVIPSALVIGKETWEKLRELLGAGVGVIGVGQPIQWIRHSTRKWTSTFRLPWSSHTLESFRKQVIPGLPRLADIRGARLTDLHASAWKRGKVTEMLIMNLGENALSFTLADKSVRLAAGELARFRAHGKQWIALDRFSPAQYSAALPGDSGIRLGTWHMRLPDGSTKRSRHPLAAYQLVPSRDGNRVSTIVTQGMHAGGGVVAKEIVYSVQITIPAPHRTAILWVEPTLMRGRFTLKAGGKTWNFAAWDTETVPQSINLPKPGKFGRLELIFTLKKPQAEDGIKANPHFTYSAQ